jgi:hypothetical protein
MRSAAVLPTLLLSLAILSAGCGQPPGVATSASPQTRLYVRTVPPGAQVMVDGKPLGASDGLFLVPAGTSRVSVQFDGQTPQVQQVEIAAGKVTRVEIGLGEAGRWSGGTAAAGDSRDFPPVGGIIFPVEVPTTLASSRTLASPPAPLTKLDDILAKPFEFACQEMPLREAIKAIGEKAGVEIFADMRALEEAGIDSEAHLTASASGRSLAASLDAVLDDLDLTWTVVDDALKVTTREAAAEELMTHVFEVTDLCEESPDALIDPIQNAIYWDSWGADQGGIGSIRPDKSGAGSFLVVSQTIAQQRRIQGLLDSLRRLKAIPADKRFPVAGEGYWNVSEPTVRARAALGKAITVSAEKTPLRDVVVQVAKEAGLPIDIDTRAIKIAGIDLQIPVTFQAGPLPLATLLERMLRPFDLTYTILSERLVVTTREREAKRISVAVYPVNRLVGAGPKGRSFESLMNLVTTTVTPLSWADNGGVAQILPLDGDPACLVIAHSTAGHRAVDAFLRSLR